MDYCFTFIFILELFIKIIASGFFFNGPDSYLKSPNNIMDFIIVIGAILASLPLGAESNLQIFKVFRLSRLMRPLRLISKNEGLKISIRALIVSIPAIVNLAVIVILFFLIFGIIGVNLLKGKFQYCDTSAIGLSGHQIQ